MSWRLLIGVLMVFGVVFGPAGPRVRAADENIAIRVALTDLLLVDPADRLFIRYVWVTDAAWENVQATVYALNIISRTSVVYRPFPIDHDGVKMLRVDLRGLAPVGTDLDELIKTWEELQFDPKFNLLLTQDTLKFAAGIGVKVPKVKRTVKDWRAVDCPPYRGQDGQLYTKKWEAFERVVELDALDPKNKVQVVRLTSEHLNQLDFSRLLGEMRTQAPIVTHSYFALRALSTVKDQGVYATIYGGLYYEFAGIKTGAKKGTDLDVLLEQLGVGNVEKGLTADRIFDQLRSDQRVAVFRSLVTGKPRRVDVIPTLAVRIGDAQAFVSITHDVKDKQIDIGTHAMMNLLAFQDDAREVIFVKVNGFPGFALFNGQGARQDEVPPDVAADRTVPSPYTPRLQPAIGCIRCHGPSDGWQVLKNDVTKLAKNYLDIFGDNTDKKKSRSDVVDRLAGLYAGDLERRLLPQARNDYATAVLRATGPWRRSKDQTDVARLVAERISDIYGRHVYDMIDAQRALFELDVVVEPENAVETLKGILPPVAVAIDGIVPEDPRTGALLTGLSIKRSDFDLIYSFIATRKSQKK